MNGKGQCLGTEMRGLTRGAGAEREMEVLLGNLLHGWVVWMDKLHIDNNAGIMMTDKLWLASS